LYAVIIDFVELGIKFLKNHTKDVFLPWSYFFLMLLHYLLTLNYLFYSFPSHPPQAVPLTLKGKAFCPLHCKYYDFMNDLDGNYFVDMFFRALRELPLQKLDMI